ncbi:hypothetical protein UPYG_G00017930 [Umbra pygmaea]|uniref:Calponin-homology (CH) domain-containing protein n=1 Tax=Umbra pygmaea TaxID=75934 RepID=A0ABD0Y459_UMBPY
MSTHSVQINPPVVEFINVKAGEVYKTTVTVTNTGNTSIRMRLLEPKSKLFTFRVTNTDTRIAAGLSLSGNLEFSPNKNDNLRDRLLLFLEDKPMEIPILVFYPACSLMMESLVDFGSVVANSEVISKEVELTNQGSAPGAFHVLYDGDPTIRLTPTSGVLQPGATQWLKVELCTEKPSSVHLEAQVKLQNREDVVLTIQADVVKQSLELQDLEGRSLPCLRFGPVFFGTSRVEQVVLVNNGPQDCDWVVVLQDDAPGTEVAVDLQKCADAVLLDRSYGNRVSSPVDPFTVIQCVPKEGGLKPYEKTLLWICFSPVNGRKSTEEQRFVRASSASRHDYSLFLKFVMVGIKDDLHQSTVLPHNGRSVELAVTASAHPVSLVPSPGHSFSFQQCLLGERVDILCVLHNHSPLLPVTFRFRRIANFLSDPSSGTIAAGQCQDVVLSFAPHQIGTFKVSQILELLGQVVHLEPTLVKLRPHTYHTITLKLSAVCRGQTTTMTPNLNLGITPAVTNETGQNARVPVSELGRCAKTVRAAVLSAATTRIHSHRSQPSHVRSRSLDGSQRELLAFPNDRACSLRPSSPGSNYRTIFTGVERYSYVDRDYALTEEEEEQRKRHRGHYLTFIRNLRRTRLLRETQRVQRVQDELENDVDIGIRPAAGLIPPKLTLRDMESKYSQDGRSLAQKTSQLMSNCTLAPMVTRSTSIQVTEGINALPTTSQEVADCTRVLTAQQRNQLVIDPCVDFGEVCVGSVCVRALALVNGLQGCVLVKLELDCCPELQLSSPLSCVLPPLSSATLPLVFQSTDLGHFHKSFSYTVNERHRGHVLAQSHVVPLDLQLSQSLVVLNPSPNSLAVWGTVTLVNSRNHPADFTWRPLVTERGITFSIRPASGTVEPYRELHCEVVWHPSFFSPLEGEFDLCVQQGNTVRLQCVATLGTTSVHLAEKHLVFRSAPINLPSVRTATLLNTGHSHAYFQVLDLYPLPGMVVTPTTGIVPAGGQVEIQVHLTPGAVMKFDTRIEIALRNMKSLELRVGGSVEPPMVNISAKSFLFHGVHSGSSHAVPFCLTNHSSAQAWVQFDLSEHTDFSMHVPPHSAGRSQEAGKHWIDLPGQQSAECCLVFSPKQVAAYDFNLPVTVNGIGLCSPPDSSTPKSSSSSRAQHIITPRPQPVSMVMLSCRVQATALRAPMEMSQTSLHFDLESAGLPTRPSQAQSVELRNVSEKMLVWRFDCSAAVTTEEGGSEGLFTLVPTAGSLEPNHCVSVTVTVSSATVEQISVSIPLFLSDEGEDEGGVPHPYRLLSLSATGHPPGITFLPPRVLLTPVPLDTPTSTTLSLLPIGYHSGSCLHVQTEEVVLKDGSRLKPLSVSLPHNGTIPAHLQNPITCTVTFCAPQPLAFTSHITFLDHLNNSFQVEVCATADNSLLTVWPYLALHRSQQQIVLKSERSEATGKAVLQPRCSPSPLSPHTSSTSTVGFLASTSTYSISEPVGDSTSRNGSLGPGLGPVGKEDFLQKERGSGGETVAEGGLDVQQRGVPFFPEQDSEEGLYYHAVLQAVQKWFSQFGWPRGPNPISLPNTLRQAVCKSMGIDGRVSQAKHRRTIYDMLHYLSGKPLPGVSSSQSLPSKLTGRMQQLLHQHTILLAFLRTQGACLPHIRPEYLLDYQEFSHCISLQVWPGENKMEYTNVTFESLSKRAWTDVLLQTYKVLVLPRVTENSMPLGLQSSARASWEQLVPRINPEPLASNVYSSWERRLLTWLNLHYHTMRTIAWGPPTCTDIPSARWVVNFDLDLADGLVLAAVLAAYCPFLIPSHLHRMYTCSSCLEQRYHNNMVFSHALTLLGLDVDIQPTELSDPNPVQMLMLCVYLYERLPQYIPRTSITLSGSLHHTFTKQVRLKSSCSRPVVYHASIMGKESHLFTLPQGASITIPPKGRGVAVTVQYTCNFLRPVEAVLLLTSGSAAGPPGVTLAFSIQTQVTQVNPNGVVKCTSPCYLQKEIHLRVTNIFNKEASFRLVLVESEANLLQMEESQVSQDTLLQRVTARTDPSSDTRLKAAPDSEEVAAGDTHFDPRDECGVDEFFSPISSVCLAAGQTDTIEIHYLPFHPGTRHCTVLLVNQQVGELVYLVKGTADLPPPSPLDFKPSPNVVHVNSATSGGADPLAGTSLRCGVGCTLDEVVCVPLVNKLRERALATMGQRRMGPVEKQRRLLTQTLDSSSVRAGVAATKLTTSQVSGLEWSPVVQYSVEASLPEHFLVPDTISLPVSGDTPVTQDNITESEVVFLPLRFHALQPGRFRCQLVLRSWRDIRVHILEVLVTEEGCYAHLEFTSPANLSITQDIPLNNDSSQDWCLQGVVSGRDFYGPTVVHIRAGEQLCYPLTFRPTTQSTVTGMLSLLNDSDGTEHSFTLRGVGLRPLPLDIVVLRCAVGQVTQSTLHVPNYTAHALTCQVVSDLAIVSGPPTLDTKPGHNVPYTLSVSPWERGKHTGSLSFMAMESQEETEKESGAYEVWYSLQVTCDPAPPLKVLAVQCAVQRSVAVAIPLNNPEAEPLELRVCLEGEGLSGDTQVFVPPTGRLTYTASFSPAVVGKRTGSVIFQSEQVGEFWYQLDLLAQPPLLTTLPESSCELGKWTRLYIPLVNPTDQTLELGVVNSNPRHFILELDSSLSLTVGPHSSTQVPVRFSPSTIGTGSHTAKVSFTCSQLEQWDFQLRGQGLAPRLMEALSMASTVGSHSSIIIPFKNPTDHPALLDISLTEEEPGQKSSTKSLKCDTKVFCVPLKQTQGVWVSSGATVDIPVIFTPDSMQHHQAWLQVQLEPFYNQPDLDSPYTSMHRDMGVVVEDGRVRLVGWVYPIHGITEAPPAHCQPAVIQCEARSRVEERVEVLLTGCVPGSSSLPNNTPSESAAGSSLALEDFLCEMRYNSGADRTQLDGCVALSLLDCHRDPDSGIVSIGVNLIFAPCKPLRCVALLAVQCVTGGLWTFPISLVCTEPQLDDVISIEAAGLHKTSSVGFRLTSLNRYPEPFTAGFLPGGGRDFQVYPASGELLPLGSAGTLITISFTPTMYSKKHRATLLVQTADMQWNYDVRGTMPTYAPPRFTSSIGGRYSREAPPTDVRQRNFVSRNLRLPAVANSSPFKQRESASQIR